MRLAIVSRRSLFACSSIDETRNGKLVIAVEKARLAQPMLTTVIGQCCRAGGSGRASRPRRADRPRRLTGG
jgi:hypothetical protein